MKKLNNLYKFVYKGKTRDHFCYRELPGDLSDDDIHDEVDEWIRDSWREFTPQGGRMCGFENMGAMIY